MCDKIEWSDSYLLGIPEIDNQHKKLLRIADELYSAATGTGADLGIQLSKVLKNLTDYTVYHFDSEEKFMRSFGYPGADMHKTAHDNFIAEVNSNISALSSVSRDDALRFYKYMVSWVVNHIAKADTVWAKYVLAHRANG